ncbi:MAG: mycothiol synthase [Propionibacteriales bacterium]|nr:mycothiol synthase [Propionibacteriales bacterium]
MSKSEAEILVLRTLDTAQRSDVRRIVDSAAARDGVAPVNEQTLLNLAYGGKDVRHLLARTAGNSGWTGYAQLLGSDDRSATAEAVVHPEHRGRGLGTTLLERLLTESAPRFLRIWAHGDLPDARSLAGRLGLRRERDLWKMRCPLAGPNVDPLPEVSLPAGVTVRTFRPGADEDAWLAVNARAFAKHPEQGSITRADLEQREREPWFDPAGFFLAEHGGELVGFHWTKVHGPETGEVYVLGVDPGTQGLGLGRVLTLVGLHHLRDLGMNEVLLYVEGDNEPAIKVYRRLGFTHIRSDVMYESGAPTG